MLYDDNNKPGREEREEQGADEHDQVQHLDGKPELDVVLPLLFDAHFQKVVGDEAEDAAGDPQAQEDVDGCPLVGVDGEVVAEQGQAHQVQDCQGHSEEFNSCSQIKEEAALGDCHSSSFLETQFGFGQNVKLGKFHQSLFWEQNNRRGKKKVFVFSPALSGNVFL